MGIFNLFRKKEQNPEDIDYISNAEKFEKESNFSAAIEEYEKLLAVVYAGKMDSRAKIIRKKIVSCYLKLADYDKVCEMWPLQYDSSDYGPKEMMDLIKILEQGQRNDLILRVYDAAGNKLLGNKIEFLMKIKKIPEANRLLSEVLSSLDESHPKIEELWMKKARLSMSLMKWEEANKFLDKILDKNTHNMDARRMKSFCIKQIKGEE